MRYSGKWFCVVMIIVGIGIGGFLLVRRDAGAAAQFPAAGNTAYRQPMTSPPAAPPVMPPQAGVIPPPAPMLVPASEAAPLFVMNPDTGQITPHETHTKSPEFGESDGLIALPEYHEFGEHREFPHENVTTNTAVNAFPGAGDAVETLCVTGISSEPELSQEQFTTAIFTSESGLTLNRPDGTLIPVRYFHDASNAEVPFGMTLAGMENALETAGRREATPPPDGPISTWMINPSVAPIASSVPASSAIPTTLALVDSPAVTPTEMSPAIGTVTPTEMATDLSSGTNVSSEAIPTDAGPAPQPSSPAPPLPLPLPPPTGTATQENIPQETGPPSIAPVDNIAPVPISATVERRVLSSQQGASVLVETIGIPRISVGKEAAFEVVVRNPGNIQAGGLLISASLPPELEVRSVSADLGEARSQAGSCEWTLPKLDPYGSATMTIVGIPHAAKLFTLPIRVTIPAVEDSVMFEVLEPKMAMTIEGPPRLIADRSEVFRLVLQNSGNGDAEDVRIILSTLADGQDREATIPHNIGTITPGDPMQLDMRMTARRPGPLRVRVTAVNDLLGTLAEATTTVEVCKPELSVTVEGPGIQYVGGCVNYRFTLRNTGTATAENVAVVATLPETARWITEKPDVTLATLAGQSHQMTWSLPNLEPGEEQTCVIGVESLRPGACVAQVEASAAGDLHTTAQLPSNVEAVATLVMDIAEPGRPVFLENEAVYTLTLTNPGSAEAMNVEVLGEFGTGIREITADGAKYRTQANRIQFEPIAAIAPGSNVTLTIRTKSQNSGNSVWRFQATASGDGLQVARQGTTRFYGEDGAVTKTTTSPRAAASNGTLGAISNGATNRTGGNSSTAAVASPFAAPGGTRSLVPLSGSVAPVEAIGSATVPHETAARRTTTSAPATAGNPGGVENSQTLLLPIPPNTPDATPAHETMNASEEKRPSTEHRFLG